MSLATSCTHSSCRRTTTDASGRCHDHRTTTRVLPAGSTSPPPPAASSASPSTTRRRKNGTRVEIYLNENQEIHREDGPAEIEYLPDGTVSAERWSRRGASHRHDGPASVGYRSDGSVSFEAWSVNGRLHRIDGPAAVTRKFDGTASAVEYYVHGKGVAEPEGVLETLRQWSPELLREEIENSALGVLLHEGAPEDQVLTAVQEGVTTVEGLRGFLAGAPAEWVRAYEEGIA